MRRLDRWLGIPGCFVLSVMFAMQRLFFGAAAPSVSAPPRTILFVCLAEIGALVLAHPAIMMVRRRFPDAEIRVITFSEGRSMLEIMGLGSNAQVILESRSLFKLATSTIRALVDMRRQRVDATINLEVYARFSAMLCALSGARTRIGFHRFYEEGGYIGGMLTHRLIYSPHHHITVSYRALAAALTERPDRCEPRAKRDPESWPQELLQVTADPAGVAQMRATLCRLFPAFDSRYRLILLNANTSDLVQTRRWPPERYLDLATRLLAEERVVVGFTGAPSERNGVEALVRQLDHPRAVCLAGETSLRSLIDLFHVADLLVTNDSGPAHFASVTGLTTIVLFGPETPRIFGPVGRRQRALYLGLACSPCVSVYNQKRSPCTDNRCMTGLTVDRVFEVVRSALTKRQND